MTTEAAPASARRTDVHGPYGPLAPLRGLVFGLLALILTPLAWFAALVALAFQPRRGRLAGRVANLWGRGILVAAGARLRVEGAEHLPRDEPRLFVANHASFLDPALALAVCPASLRFVLKRELGRFPFIGWHTRLAGHLLLDRSNARAGKAVVDRAVARARDLGLCPIVFAEGTRSEDGRLQPLKPGALQIAIDAGIPVQVIAILGTSRILPKHAWGPHRGGTVVARVAPAIPVAGYEGSPGRKALAARVREVLLSLGVPAGADA